MGYHAGKPIESVVYCLYKITLSKTENVSVFYEFTSTISHRLLTNQKASTILVILKSLLKALYGPMPIALQDQSTTLMT